MSFSGSRNCICPNRTASRYGKGDWVVLQRKQNLSLYGTLPGQPAKVKPSRWSHVICSGCGTHFRTTGKFVDFLPNAAPELREALAGHLVQGTKVPLKILAKVPRKAIRPRGRPRQRKTAYR